MTEIQQFRTPKLDFTEAQFQGEELKRFQARARNRFSQACSTMHEPHRKARVSLRVFNMLLKNISKKWDDEPNITTPITRDKGEDLFAQIFEATDHDPYVSIKGKNVRDSEVGKIAECLFQEKVMSDPQIAKNVKVASARRAISQGTGIGYISIREEEEVNELGEVTKVYLPEPQSISILDFWTDRLASDCIVNGYAAVRREMYLYQIEELFFDGTLDQNQYNAIKGYFSSDSIEYSSREVNQQEPQSVGSTTSYDDETKVVEIFECWLEYRPLSTIRGEKPKIYFFKYHAASDTIVSKIYENPFEKIEAFTGIPIQPIRTNMKSDWLLGDSMYDLIRTWQDSADESMYTHAVLNQFAANPPRMFYQHAPFAEYAEEGTLSPGMWIPVDTPQRLNENIVTIDFQNNGLALNDVGVSRQMADLATFDRDGGGGSRQTSAEYQLRAQIANLKVNVSMKQYTLDMNAWMDMVFSAFAALYIKPNNIIEVGIGDGSKLIAWDEVSPSEIAESATRQAFAEATPEEPWQLKLGEALNEILPKLTDSRIPSIRSSGLKVCLTGNQGLENRFTEARKYQQLGIYMQAIMMLKPEGLWYYLKRYMQTLGIEDWQDMIGDDPTGMENQDIVNSVSEQIAKYTAQLSTV